MRLYEHEAAQIFSDRGIPVPRFEVARSPTEARGAASRIGGPVVLKAMVLVGGRGKAGGVRRARTPAEAEKIASEMLGGEIRGEAVRALMVAEQVEVERELYLSIILERSEASHLLLASGEGGMEIEEIAAQRPESLARIAIDPLIGLRDYQLRRAIATLELAGDQARSFAEVAKRLYSIYRDYGCELAEINPLVVSRGGGLRALDAKMIIDDNAVKTLGLELGREEGTGLEAEARRLNFTYVELDGDIGIIGNGAGLTMATMDMVKLYGGRPANFLDIGGGASAETVYKAATLLLRNERVKIVLLNVLGGITRCDEVAAGIVKAMKEDGRGRRLVVRLVGTREEEGRRILRENGYEYLESMEEAARKAVEMASAPGGTA